MASNHRRSGTIVAKGPGRWLVRVYVGVDPQTGKRSYHSEIVRGTKTNANRLLARLQHQKDTGRLVERTRETVASFLESWLEKTAKQRVRERTLHDYRYLIDRYVVPYVGAIPLQKLTLRHIQERMIATLQAQGLSSRTIRLAHGVLSNALRTAMRMDLLASNPAVNVELPRSRKPEMKALTPEEVGTFLKATTGTRHHPFFVLAVDTGARPGELLALRWEDVDFDKAKVTIRRSLQRKRKGEPWRFEDPKTERSRRTIDITASTVKELRAHRRSQAEEKLAAGPLYGDQDLVFAGPTGQPVDGQNLVNRIFKPALKRAGLDHSIRLYDLRHTTATMLLTAGLPVNVVSERLGHAGSQITLDRYVERVPNMQAQAAERMERLLGGHRSSTR